MRKEFVNVPLTFFVDEFLHEIKSESLTSFENNTKVVVLMAKRPQKKWDLKHTIDIMGISWMECSSLTRLV